ncbi:sodium/hydrogen exchanger 2 [Channa argus]|uniref:sodium/hydrogen exchanger 2 n=1 Tax=Channa argus TaxID=215402 RepID=UPI003522FAB4
MIFCRTGALLAIFAALGFYHGSRGEISSGGVTVVPPIKPSDPPHPIPDGEKADLPLFKINYPRIQIPLEITLWMLLASFAKIGFNVYHKITIWVPESCLLISMGLIVGGIIYCIHQEPPAVLTSNVFFLYMLPPLVLESGYFIPTRPFFENIGTVLWFAVVGTLWNIVGMGLSLFAICQIEAFGVQDINLQENLLFATIISAVDPVAVLSVFEDVSVNEQLYIAMFGECLFNDAVTVALYNILAFVANMPVVESVDFFLGVMRFFVVGLGGMGFGILSGFFAAFTTRFTSKVREIEPLIIFMYSYLAYLVAELFAMSSIMAIVTCAITMKYYVEENVSQRSCTTIRHMIKMFGSISETVIFFFLGVVTVTTEHTWNWGYILFTLLFAFVWRGLGVLFLAQIINFFRTIPFNFKDQFGLTYGGLRGAVSFALAFTLPHNISHRQLFVTATIALILFTVFLQGISIRPLIKFINIRKTSRKLDTINAEVHCRLMEHTVAGIEDVCGQWSHYYLKDKFRKFNNRFLRKILIRDSRAESSIVSLYKKLELQNSMEILDTVFGDISAAPSLISLYEERKNSAKPEKKFLASDLKNMHNILSKNMYTTRQPMVAYTRKHALPNESHTKEILLRRHASIPRNLRCGIFRQSMVPKYFSLPAGEGPSGRQRNAGNWETMSEAALPSRHSQLGHPAHCSSSSMVPLRRRDTKNTPSIEVVNEGRYVDRHIPAPRNHINSSLNKSNFMNVNHGAQKMEQQLSSPSSAWAAEPRDGVTQKSLLRPKWNPAKT